MRKCFIKNMIILTVLLSGLIIILVPRIVHATTVDDEIITIQPTVDQKPALEVKKELPTKKIVAVNGTKVMAEISGYTSSVDETDSTPFITASGQRTRYGIIACPSRFKFGQEVIINGKTYECQDRMNARYRDKNNFDIWFETKAEAFAWGRRTVEVTIVSN
jgi:3D (Asp-Asp-Asp) domain-containing protein